MSKWYLIHSKPKQEYRAFEQLENQSFDVFLPKTQTFKLKKSKQETVIEPLFPRYFFIRLDETSSAWHKIRSTRGVSGLVRFSEFPAEVPEMLIKHLKEQANSEGVIDKTGEIQSIFKAGDLVTITDGSFIGLEAVIKEQDGDQRVKILISMLGQQQSIKLPLSAVSPI